MKFLDIIKDSIIKNYQNDESLNYSLAKKIKEGNIKAIRDGLPFITSTFMDYGSYIDAIITKDKNVENIYVYKSVELADHAKKLVNFLIDTNNLECDIESRLKIADKLDLWRSTKKLELREKLCNSDKINIIINREIERKKGRYVISDSDLKTATIAINTLNTHDHSKDILHPSLKIEMMHQVAISFKFNKVNIKVLLDILQVDHKNKTIRPIDLKTGSDKNFLKNYNKYSYWMQASLYYLAILSLVKKYKKLKDYKVLPFQFLYISRDRIDTPLIYELNENKISKYVEGYIDNRGIYNKGIIDYLEDYKFHKETGIYDRTKDEYESNGVIALPAPY